MAGTKGPIGASLSALEPEDTRCSRDPEDDDDAPKPKRRRTAIACTACRIRKSRCNGKRPKCSMCDSLAFDCVYEASDSSVNVIVSKEHMSEVEARLHRVEAKMQQHDQMFDTHERRLQNIVNDRAWLDRTPALLPQERNTHFQPSDTTDLRSAGVQELLPEEASTDGMAITYINEEDSGYFGQTSNISFMRHISRAMVLAGNPEGLTSPLKIEDAAELDNGIVNVSRPPSPNPGGFQSQSHHAHPDVTLNSLPSEKITRELIGRYFSNTGRLFPYIHEPTFMETYEQMKAANFTKVRRTWLGLLNMVLAMAFNATAHQPNGQSAKERIAQSDVFYQRALGLCQTQILRGTSLETVQYLLLMSQYLQGTQKSVQTWSIHGLAVKAAHSIGLHSSDAFRAVSPIEREYRKRTWFGCVILDRILSMTFGRPMTIPEDHVRLPLPQTQEDDIPSSELGNFQPSDQTRGVAFFNGTITLYKITARVISTLYGGNLGCDPPLSKKEMAAKIFQFEQEIDDWNHALPDYMRLISSSSISLVNAEDPMWIRFRIILSLRCLNLQILLYRPVLIRSIDRSSEDNAHTISMRSMDQMETNHIQSCLTGAKEIINIVHGVITSETLGRHVLGAWWFSLYYGMNFGTDRSGFRESTDRSCQVFNAALMAFGRLLASPKHAGSSILSDQVEDCRLLLARAIQALHQLDEGNITVQRCAQFLEQMSLRLEHNLNVSFDLLEDPNKVCGTALAGTAGGDRTRMVRFAPNINRPEQTNGPHQAVQPQAPSPTNFMFDNIYGDELELGQFFIGGGMEAWIDSQG